ncbi:MAG: hypothetical protein ACM32E_29025 [Gemmatimonadota bacterium]
MMQKAFTVLAGAARHRAVRSLAALSVAALGTGLLAAAASPTAQPTAGKHPAISTASRRAGPTERGTIVGWPGGNAVIYPTAGFFTDPQILAVGSVRPDGLFIVQLPARVPVDLLANSSSQCPTLRSSNPKALSTFTGDSLIYEHGTHIGDTHSGSTLGIASFTSFANGDTRSGFVYANRNTTLTGFCQRTITAGGVTADFRQNFDLPLHQGWNPVVADFSVPQPGHIVASLTLGTGPHERWYFFTPAAP